MAELYARHSLELKPGALAGDVESVVNPLLGQVAQLGGGLNAAVMEHLCLSATYAPDILNRELLQYFAYVLIAVHQACIVQFWVSLAQLAGNLREGLGVGHTNAYGYARVAPYGAGKLLAELFQFLGAVAIEQQECLVNGVYLNGRYVLFQGGHDALRHVAVELVVA